MLAAGEPIVTTGVDILTLAVKLSNNRGNGPLGGPLPKAADSHFVRSVTPRRTPQFKEEAPMLLVRSACSLRDAN